MKAEATAVEVAPAPVDTAILDTYHAGEEALEALAHNRVVIIAGISGAGKDTIARELAGRRGGYHITVSATTREPRKNDGRQEVDGTDYHFLALEEMAELAKAGKLVEVKGYGGKYYGTLASELDEAGKHDQAALLVIEVQGVEEIRELKPDLLAFFVVPKSPKVWEQRFAARSGGRKQINQQDLRKRMQTAQRELRHALSTSEGYHFVINDQLDAAVHEIDATVKSPTARPQEAPAARRAAEELLAHIGVRLGERSQLRHYLQALGRWTTRRAG